MKTITAEHQRMFFTALDIQQAIRAARIEDAGLICPRCERSEPINETFEHEVKIRGGRCGVVLEPCKAQRIWEKVRECQTTN